MDLAASSSEPDSSYSDWSSDGSSYGYSSSLASADSEEHVRVRPRSFHLPALSAAAPQATPLERVVLERPERPELSQLELCLGSATIGSAVLLFSDAPAWARLAACSSESQLCLLHYLHLES